MGKATAALVHTGDVYGPAARKVARNLHVANEGGAVDHGCRAAPRDTAISGVDGHESALADVKVVPGNVQCPKNGELGLLSAQPDSRSAEPSLKAQK